VTDKEKLQQLFAAALKSPVEPSGGPPPRAFPTPILDVVPADKVALSAPAPAPSQTPVAVAPAQPVTSTEETESQPAAENKPAAPVLDDAASTELAALLDEQMKRKTRKRRMEALVTAIVFFGSVGGGCAWFVQDPARVQAFKEAMRDIRSVGDVKSLVAKYQESIDRISARSKQIDQASMAMGYVKTAGDEKVDKDLDDEMRKMMGGKGRTIMDRNRDMQKNFSKMASDAGGPIKASTALKKEDSFEWKN
jgi:hypothetical protein